MRLSLKPPKEVSSLVRRPLSFEYIPNQPSINPRDLLCLFGIDKDLHDLIGLHIHLFNGTRAIFGLNGRSRFVGQFQIPCSKSPEKAVILLFFANRGFAGFNDARGCPTTQRVHRSFGRGQERVRHFPCGDPQGLDGLKRRVEWMRFHGNAFNRSLTKDTLRSIRLFPKIEGISTYAMSTKNMMARHGSWLPRVLKTMAALKILCRLFLSTRMAARRMFVATRRVVFGIRFFFFFFFVVRIILIIFFFIPILFITTIIIRLVRSLKQIDPFFVGIVVANKMSLLDNIQTRPEFSDFLDRPRKVFLILGPPDNESIAHGNGVNVGSDFGPSIGPIHGGRQGFPAALLEFDGSFFEIFVVNTFKGRGGDFDDGGLVPFLCHFGIMDQDPVALARNFGIVGSNEILFGMGIGRGE